MTSSRSAISKSSLSALATLVVALGLVIGSTIPDVVAQVRSVLIGTCRASSGSGSPASVVTGSICDLYLRTDGGSGTIIYVKESGTATTSGWNTLAALPAGSSNDVQLNVSGVFGVDTGQFTYNSTSNTLTTDNIASRVGVAFTAVATPPTGGASGAAGVGATLSASNATIGSGAGYNAGGNLTLTAGNAVGQTTGSAAGGVINITAGNAAAASGTPAGGIINITGGSGVNGLNSPGGVINITGGANGNPAGHVNITGGAATTTSAGAGNVVIAGGSASGGSSMTAGSVTIRSGGIQFTPGKVSITTGAIPAGNAFGGWGSPVWAIEILPATPAAMGTNDGGTGSAGGPVRLLSGPGGAGGGGAGANGGAGGVLSVIAGNGGDTAASAATTYTAGAGGAATFGSGTGGNTTAAPTTSNGGAGGLLSVLAGAGGNAAGGSGTRNGGAGGSLVLAAGAGGTGATSNGAPGSVQFKIGSTEFGRFHTNGSFRLTGVTVESLGTVPGISGCSAGTQTGGAVGGTFASGTTGACSVTLTFAITATTGYACFANNVTDPTQSYRQSGGTSTTATLTGTTTSGDVIRFFCFAY